MNKFPLCNEKMHQGQNIEVENNRARLISCIDQCGGIKKVQRDSLVPGTGNCWSNSGKVMSRILEVSCSAVFPRLCDGCPAAR